MKYVIWVIRFWYAGWMIPAGIEHFYHIYPQPGYYTTYPLAHETLFALLHSHLFDIVKAVELLTGLSVLLGFFTPVMLLVCMPVAFNVFWWDGPLQDWNASSLIAGSRVLASNVLLTIAFIGCYRTMFTSWPAPKGLSQGPEGSRAPSKGLVQGVLIARLVLGAWMLLGGINYLFLTVWPMPIGHEPLSAELIGAFTHSHLLDVAMWIQLVTGALLLSGMIVPAALCTLMPVSTCALYWAILDQRSGPLALALIAFGLNGLLMVAYIGYYQDALRREARTLGESDIANSWDTLFVKWHGRTSRDRFIGGLIPLALVVWFYARSGPDLYAPWDLLVLLFPATVLHARRLHDMGHSAYVLLIPAFLTVTALAIWDRLLTFGPQLDFAIPLAALVVFIAFAVWGCIGKGRGETNAFGPSVTA